MRLSGSLAAAILVVAGLTTANAAAPAPCASPEHRQFDFWIGDWQVHNPDGSVRQLWETADAKGEWSVAFDGKYTKK